MQNVPSYRLSLSKLQEYLDKKFGPKTYSVALVSDRYQITLPAGKEKLTDTEVEDLQEKRFGNLFTREHSDPP